MGRARGTRRGRQLEHRGAAGRRRGSAARQEVSAGRGEGGADWPAGPGWSVSRGMGAASLAWVVLAAPAAAASSSTAALQVALRARGLYDADVDGIRGPA